VPGFALAYRRGEPYISQPPHQSGYSGMAWIWPTQRHYSGIWKSHAPRDATRREREATLRLTLT
jgi:hypothetical protein